MSDILNELQLVKKASQEQTAASQEIATHHLASIEKVETASTQAIVRAEAEFNNSVGELTEYAIAAHKKAIEDASGGRNTIIIDAQGNPNIMVCIPRFNYEDVNAAILARTGVDLQLGTGTPTMFQTNGVARGEIYIAKYLASVGKDGGCSVVGGVQPITSINYDASKNMCENKGKNWHMLSIHEWAAIALWSLANESVPRGNTNYGRSHENKLETSRRSDNGMPGDTSGTGRTDTGKGPDTWAHDHSAWGVQDLVGNVNEWLDQMKLENGQIITTLDNDPIINEANWHKHGAFFDAPNNDQLGITGSPILSDSVTNRNGPIDDDSISYGYMHNTHFAAISQSETYDKLELLRRLLIESASTTTVDGAIFVRNYGARMPIRGGHWSNGLDAGLGTLSLLNARSSAATVISFRPAFFL